MSHDANSERSIGIFAGSGGPSAEASRISSSPTTDGSYSSMSMSSPAPMPIRSFDDTPGTIPSDSGVGTLSWVDVSGRIELLPLDGTDWGLMHQHREQLMHRDALGHVHGTQWTLWAMTLSFALSRTRPTLCNDGNRVQSAFFHAYWLSCMPNNLAWAHDL